MGDRANIVMAKDNGCFPAPVYFYGHWIGSQRKEILASALDRCRGRWTDGSYLARGIFCEMIQGDVLGETGYGISTEPGDNSYPFLMVDVPKREVYEEEDNRKDFKIGGKLMPRMSFEDFIAEFKVPKPEPVVQAIKGK